MSLKSVVIFGWCCSVWYAFRGGLPAVDTTCHLSQGLAHTCVYSASSREKRGPFSPSGTVEVRTGFSLVSVSLFFRYARISITVRGFWERPQVLNLFYSIILFLLIPTLLRQKEQQLQIQLLNNNNNHNNNNYYYYEMHK